MRANQEGDCRKNKDLSRKFSSQKWEARNTYLLMPCPIYNCPRTLGFY